MLHNGQGAVRARNSRRKVMGRLGKRITPFALTLIALFSLIGSIEAQRINAREVRDIIRNLDLKIEDFQSRLSYQLESSSASRQSSNAVLTDVRLLQLRVRGFDQDVAARRD